MLSPRPSAQADAAAAGATAASALDAAALAQLAALDPTGQGRLIERVLASFQTSVARLRPQWAAGRLGGDCAAMRLVAHTLKSSSASIGALQLSARCAQVEAAIRVGTPSDADLDAFEAALDHALVLIDRTLGAPP